MKTLLKWIFRLVITVVALLVIVPIVVTVLVDRDDIKHSIDEMVFKQTGRHVQINGDLGWRPGLNFTVYAEDIRYQNADWANPESAVVAERLTATLSLAALLEAKVRINRVELDNAVLWIQTNADGEVNLVNPSTTAPTPPKAIELPNWLEIGSVEINDSEIINVLEGGNFEIGLDQVNVTNSDPAEPLQLVAIGRLQQAKLDIHGTLGTLQSLLARTPSAAELVASMGKNGTLTAQGSVGDVLAWQGVDVTLNGTMQSLSYLDSLFPAPPPNIENIAIKAELLQPGAANQMQLNAIDGAFEYAGIAGKVGGAIGNLVSLQDMQLEISGDGEVDKKLLPKKIASAIAPQVTLNAKLAGSADAPAIIVSHAQVKIEGATLQAEGEIDNLRSDWSQPLSLTLNVDDAATIGNDFDIKLPTLGGVTATAELTSKDSSFSLNNIRVNNQSDLSNIAITGAIQNFGQSQTGELAIDAEVKPGFVTSSGYELPVKAGTLTAKGSIHLDGQKIDLVLDSAETSIPGASISASGGIPDLTNPTALSIDLKGTINKLAELGESFNVTLPEVSPVAVTATLTGKDGNWNLEDVDANADTDGLKVAAKGAISNFGPDMTANIDVEGTVTVDRVLQLAPAAAPTIEPIKGELMPIGFSGKVVATSTKDWSLADITAHSNWLGAKLDVVGNITRFSPMGGEFEVSLRGATHGQTSLLKSYPMPPLDKVDIQLTVPLPVAENGIRDIKGAVQAKSAQLKFNGDISKLSPLQGDGIKLTLVADDMDALVAGDAIFQRGNAINADLEVDFDPEKVSAQGTVKFGNSDIAGTASWQPGKDQRPKIEANIKSSRVDLVSLLTKPVKPVKEEKPKPDEDGKMLSDQPLIPAWTSKMDADLDLDIAELKTSIVSLNSVTGKAVLNNGRITSNISAISGGGSLKAEVDLKKGATNSISATMDKFPIDAINILSDTNALSGGTIAVSLNIRGAGSSVMGFLEKGSGDLTIDLYNAKMQRSALNLVGGDLLTNITSAINPFAEKSDLVGVECAVFHFKLADSKILTENGIAVKTDRVTLLGSGQITFPEESLTMTIAPKARKGLGVSASSIAKMVRIGGTLSEPAIESDAKGFIQSGAAIGAALASGGLSLFAQGLYDRLRANSDVCGIARGAYQRDGEQINVNEATRR